MNIQNAFIGARSIAEQKQHKVCIIYEKKKCKHVQRFNFLVKYLHLFWKNSQ